MIYCFNQEAW